MGLRAEPPNQPAPPICKQHWPARVAPRPQDKQAGACPWSSAQRAPFCLRRLPRGKTREQLSRATSTHLFSQIYSLDHTPGGSKECP